MWSVVVVVASPCVDDEFGVAEPFEEMFVQTLVTQTSVEAFDKAILHRFSWGDEVPGHAAFLAPFEHGI